MGKGSDSQQKAVARSPLSCWPVRQSHTQSRSLASVPSSSITDALFDSHDAHRSTLVMVDSSVTGPTHSDCGHARVYGMVGDHDSNEAADGRTLMLDMA